MWSEPVIRLHQSVCHRLFTLIVVIAKTVRLTAKQVSCLFSVPVWVVINAAHPCVLQGTVHISLFCFVNNDDPTEQDVLYVCMFVSRLRHRADTRTHWRIYRLCIGR